MIQIRKNGYGYALIYLTFIIVLYMQDVSLIIVRFEACL